MVRAIICVSIDAELAKALEELAEKLHTTKSKVVEMALRRLMYGESN